MWDEFLIGSELEVLECKVIHNEYTDEEYGRYVELKRREFAGEWYEEYGASYGWDEGYDY